MRTIHHMLTPASMHETLLGRYRDAGMVYVEAGTEFLISVDETIKPPLISVMCTNPSIGIGFILDGETLQLCDSEGNCSIPATKHVEDLALKALQKQLG